MLRKPTETNLTFKPRRKRPLRERQPREREHSSVSYTDIELPPPAQPNAFRSIAGYHRRAARRAARRETRQ